jgi:hypothetical protein
MQNAAPITFSSINGTTLLDGAISGSSYSTTFNLPNTNGSSGNLLATDGSGNTSWVSSPGISRNIVQTSSTSSYTTTTAGLATNLSVSITPTSASSQVLVTVSGVLNAGSFTAYSTVLRNGSNLAGGGDLSYLAGGTSSISYSYLDSPATTSATTYVVWFGTSTGQSVGWNPIGTLTTIIVQEV